MCVGAGGQRGLPVPLNPSLGGMLKGLLMQRQSRQRQVLGPPFAPMDVDENGAGAPLPTDASLSEASGGGEPIYRDTAQVWATKSASRSSLRV